MTFDMDTLWKILAVVFAAGVVWAKLESIQKDIARLEEKVEKHNSFDRRIVAIETQLNMREREENVHTAGGRTN